jgi:ArsR family transcriptional regulator
MREWRELRLYFRALADVRRLRMVSEMARTPEISVKELCLRLRASQPLVSWHLRVLVRCGLVTTRRQGRQVFCSLNRAAFVAYQARLTGLIGEGARDDDLDSREEIARLVVPPPLRANT